MEHIFPDWVDFDKECDERSEDDENEESEQKLEEPH
jgi:hypothetical protein